MKRILVGAFAAALLVTAPAYAQSIEDQVASQLAASGIDPATAGRAQIEAALDSVLVAAVEAQLGGSAAAASSADLAAAVSALIANNPNLSTASVAALTSAAASENQEAAAAVVGAAVAARPSGAVQITRAAVEAAPSQAIRVAASASEAVVNAGGSAADVAAVVANAVRTANAAGVEITVELVAEAVSSKTGTDGAEIIIAVGNIGIQPRPEILKVGGIEDGYKNLFNEEQDASPT